MITKIKHFVYKKKLIDFFYKKRPKNLYSSNVKIYSDNIIMIIYTTYLLLKYILTFDKGLILCSAMFSCSKLACLSFISDKEVRSSNFCVSKALLDRTSFKINKYYIQINDIKSQLTLPFAMLLPFVLKNLFSLAVCSLTLVFYLIVHRLARIKLIPPYVMLRVRFPTFAAVPEK